MRAYASYAQGYTIADVGRILRGITEERRRYRRLSLARAGHLQQPRTGRRGGARPAQGQRQLLLVVQQLGSRLVLTSDGIFEVVRAPVDIEGLELSLAADARARSGTVGRI